MSPFVFSYNVWFQKSHQNYHFGMAVINDFRYSVYLYIIEFLYIFSSAVCLQIFILLLATPYALFTKINYVDRPLGSGKFLPQSAFCALLDDNIYPKVLNLFWIMRPNYYVGCVIQKRIVENSKKI